MLTSYIRAMDVLHRLCMIISGICLVVISLIIPWGVFTRSMCDYPEFALARWLCGLGSSWPEPMAVLLVIWFSFLSAALCYRERLHIGVNLLPNLLRGRAQTALGWFIELAVAGTTLFMLIWGVRLVHTTWFQSIAEFPGVSVGLSYLPVPIGGGITVLFVIERLWTGVLFTDPHQDDLVPISSE